MSRPLETLKSLCENSNTKLLSENLLDRNQLAKRLGISKSYVSKLMAEENLPYIKLGRSVRFSVEEVVTFLQKRSRR